MLVPGSRTNKENESLNSHSNSRSHVTSSASRLQRQRASMPFSKTQSFLSVNQFCDLQQQVVLEKPASVSPDLRLHHVLRLWEGQKGEELRGPFHRLILPPSKESTELKWNVVGSTQPNCPHTPPDWLQWYWGDTDSCQARTRLPDVAQLFTCTSRSAGRARAAVVAHCRQEATRRWFWSRAVSSSSTGQPQVGPSGKSRWSLAAPGVQPPTTPGARLASPLLGLHLRSQEQGGASPPGRSLRGRLPGSETGRAAPPEAAPEARPTF